MKKFSILCAYCLTLSALAYTMTDFDTAKYLADNGIITPQTTATKYRLDDKILRQEVIGMALKIKGVTLPENYTCKKYFADATKNDWVCRAVELAADNGIITRSNKYANPGKSITRAEALAMVMKAGGVDTDLSDEQLNSLESWKMHFDTDISWHQDIILKALFYGIIDMKRYVFNSKISGLEGVTGNSTMLEVQFAPNRLTTRAEVFGFTKNILFKSATKTATAYTVAINDNTITLDYFDIFSGEEAKKMMVADGECTQEQLVDENICFPNGVIYFRNINPKLRTFKLASNTIITVTDQKEDIIGTKQITVQDFKRDYSNGYPFRITFNTQGEVSALEEIFVP